MSRLAHERPQAIFWFVIVPFICRALWILFTEYRGEPYITNKRVCGFKKGVGTFRQSLDGIETVKTSYGWAGLGRLGNYGTVTITGPDCYLSLDYILEPEMFQHRLEEEIKKYKKLSRPGDAPDAGKAS